MWRVYNVHARVQETHLTLHCIIFSGKKSLLHDYIILCIMISRSRVLFALSASCESYNNIPSQTPSFTTPDPLALYALGTQPRSYRNYPSPHPFTVHPSFFSLKPYFCLFLFLVSRFVCLPLDRLVVVIPYRKARLSCNYY